MTRTLTKHIGHTGDGYTRFEPAGITTGPAFALYSPHDSPRNLDPLNNTRGINLRDSNPGLSGEQLVQGSPSAAIRFDPDMYCLVGFGIDVQVAATAPINPDPYYMCSR